MLFPEELDKTKELLEDIESKARKGADQYLSIAERAGQGITIIDWFKHDVWPLIDGAVRVGQFENLYNEASGTFYYQTLQMAQRSLENEMISANALMHDVNFVVGSTSTLTSGISAGLFPHVRAVSERVKLTFPPIDRTDLQTNIDKRLIKLMNDDSLASKRRGAWTTFNLMGQDSFSQACHSMREVLTQLLDKFCINKDIENAEWWARDKDAPMKVTKRQKIKYFIVGKYNYPIENEIDEIDRQVAIAKKAHDKATNIAHRVENDKERTREILIGLEDAIGNLLELREHIMQLREDELQK